MSQYSGPLVLLAAADAIADQTVELMTGKNGAIGVIPFRRESA
jgi:hypothetical protein